jgi:hypothetical protein
MTLPIFVIAWLLSMHYNKREKAMRDESEAHRKILEGTYVRIWQNIKQRCGISEEYRRKFDIIYPDIISQSLDNEQFIDWILDCNPDFDPQEYVPLLESIAFEREKFVKHQYRMMELINEHRKLVTHKPACWLTKNCSAIQYDPMDTEYTRWSRSI